MTVESVNYCKCPKCSFVYDSRQTECPECGTPTPINEELDNSVIFNIND